MRSVHDARGARGLQDQSSGLGEDNGMGGEAPLLSQTELDAVLDNINHLIGDSDDIDSTSLIDELKDAILDSGKLKLSAWKSLRARLREIEALIPHIDLIIELKEKREDAQPFGRA